MVITAKNTKLKPGYKQTEIGVLPEDWEVKKLSEVCNYQNGTSLEKYFNGFQGLNVISIGNYSIDGKYIDTKSYIDWKYHRKIKRFILRHNELCMILNDKTSIGAIIGRVLLIKEDNKYVFNQRSMRITPYDNISSAYLYYVINSDLLHNKIISLAKPGTQIYVNTGDVTGLDIPVPKSPEEQTAIATVLSDIDSLVESLNKLIAKKRDIKQATMQQLLTGKTRLPEFSGELKPAYKQTEVGMIPEDWDIYSVEEIADVTTGDKDTQDKTESGAYPFFVRSQTIERINSYSYDGEAVLTAGDGVGVGKVFHYANGKFDFHQRVYMISNFRRCDGFFFYLYFSNNFYKEATKYNAKNSVDSVRREMVTGMRIPCPPLPEQKTIAAVLSDMDAEIAALEQKRDKTRALKQGMMQELLTGKTRLV